MMIRQFCYVDSFSEHCGKMARLACLGFVVVHSACTPTPGGGGSTEPVWRSAFDASDAGALSAVWGSASDDIFVVGGSPGQGEVHHFDGATWSEMEIPSVPLLVWVFGFGPRDVFAVGENGGAIHYDGTSWRLLDTGSTADLWGVWGPSREELWVVGSDSQLAEPVILRFDGSRFSPVTIPDNDRGATALFKVWGIGSKVFAVGENGLILQYSNGDWFQVPAGADANDDFVSLWGTSETNIVAVGGRSSARIARYDGTQWNTELFSGTPGLNAVYMVDADEAIVGGTNGYAGRYDLLTGELDQEDASTNLCLHGIWGDGEGSYYAVGGRFSTPYTGLAIVRTIETSMSGATQDDTPRCAAIDDCPGGQTCSGGVCVAEGTGSESSCINEPDCALGESCSTGVCVSSDGSDVQYWAVVGLSYGPVADGGNVNVHRGFQGGVHTFVSVRTTGFAPGASALLTIGIILVEDGRVLVTPRALPTAFSDLGGGVNEAQGIFTRLENTLPGELDRKQAIVTLTVADIEDGSISASLTQTVTLIEVEDS